MLDASLCMKLNKILFFFQSLNVYLFKNCTSQFLSHWKPVFCFEELSFLPNKNKAKVWSSVLFGKIQNFLYAENYTYAFFHFTVPPCSKLTTIKKDGLYTVIKNYQFFLTNAQFSSIWWDWECLYSFEKLLHVYCLPRKTVLF